MTQVRLAAILTIASAASMALEIVAGRMIAPYVGMSLYTWTAVIAVVLAGLAVGHWAGGILAGNPRKSGSVLVAMLLAGAGAAFVTPWLLRGVAGGVLGAFDPVPGVVALTGAVFFMPSLFAGAVGPLATFLALEEAEDATRGRVLGRMYALGAVGAIVGVLLGGLVLIPYLGSALSVVVIAASYALAAAMAAQGRFAQVGAIMLALGVTVVGTVLQIGASPCLRESGYFCIRVDDLSPTTRVLALDHLAHGVNERADPLRLHSPYIAGIDEIAKMRFDKASPRSVYFIGGGAYTLPRAWATRWPDAALTVAEIDPMVTEVAAKQMWVDTTAFDIVHADARRTLIARTERLDAVVGDAFADVSIPPHLVTDEFHALIAERLRPDGFYAMNVVDLSYRPAFMTSLAETLKKRFPVVELWIDPASISEREARTTWIVLAAHTPTTAERIEAADGSRREWVRVPIDRMIASVPSRERVFLTDDHAPVGRLLGPLLRDARYAE